MTKTFVTSDTHFNHVNILKYCPNRGHASVEEMNADMIRVWNEVVGVEDTVYFIGDFAMGKKEYHIDFLNALNGTIRIVPGNHDYYIKKLHKKGGLPPHVEMLPPIYNLSHGGKQFVLCHFPIAEWEAMTGHSSDGRTGAIHYHGHVHGENGAVTGPDRYDIGWDVYGKPVEFHVPYENI
jgi:calcineurin-like phosphoesterase family protein